MKSPYIYIYVCLKGDMCAYCLVPFPDNQNNVISAASDQALHLDDNEQGGKESVIKQTFGSIYIFAR